MEYFAFNADDVACGHGRAIVSMGERRFMFNRLDAAQLAALRAAQRARCIHAPSTDLSLLQALRTKGVVAPITDGWSRRSGRPTALLVPSRIVSPIANALATLTRAPALALIAASCVIAFVTGEARPMLVLSLSHWLVNVTAFDFAVACLLFTACIVVHEIGHAAACYRQTGMVGAIRVRLYRGIPVFTTDVSSLCLATARGKALIAITGIVFQVAVSVLLLMTDIPSFRIGATLSLMSAAFAIVPLPGSDGYWFLSDLFRVRINGMFGISGQKDWMGYSYTAWLVGITAYFCYIILRDAGNLLLFGWSLRRTNTVYAPLFVVFALYAIVVAALFARRTFIFLDSGECGTR